MRIKPRPEIDIGKDTFASHDLLGRDKLAEQLSQAIDSHSEPLVIALDDGWGSGKSYFLKLWVGEHKQKHPKTTIIYFDAFKHDYLDDPLASLVFRLEEELKDNKAVKAIKKATVPLLKATLSYFTGGASNQAIDEYNQSIWTKERNRIKAMDNFTRALKDLAQEGQLVFIVDELDRCRPDYPLKLLEIIKHFFWVENVHFILGANFTALENSVKAKYGESIADASAYLKKFVNLRMQFLPVYGEVSTHSLALTYFDEFCKNRIEKGDSSSEKTDPILSNARKLLELSKVGKKLSLRDVDQLFARLSLFPKDEYSREIEVVQGFLAFVAILETINKKYFNEMMGSVFVNKELGDEIRSFLGISAESDMDRTVPHFQHIEYYQFIKHACLFLVDVGHVEYREIIKKIPPYGDKSINADNDSNRVWIADHLRNKLKIYFTIFEIS